jgi:hypothetical protein
MDMGTDMDTGTDMEMDTDMDMNMDTGTGMDTRHGHGLGRSFLIQEHLYKIWMSEVGYL